MPYAAPGCAGGRLRSDWGDAQPRADGLIACVYGAAEWRHKAVELAAHELLQRLDARSA